MMRVNRQQLEATINLLKAKVRIHDRLVHCYKVKGTREREFIQAAAPMLGVHVNILERYLVTHKDFDAANGDLLDMQLAGLKSELAIHEAMLQEGEKAILLAGPGTKLT